MGNLRIGRIAGAGAVCAAIAFAITSGSSGAAIGGGGGGATTTPYASLSDNQGEIQGDVTGRGREGLFTLDNYDVEFLNQDCSPLVMEMPYNKRWGRLTGDVGEVFSIVQIEVYERDRQGREKLGIVYEFNSPVLMRARHSNAKKLTLTFEYQNVRIEQDGDTEDISCDSG